MKSTVLLLMLIIISTFITGRRLPRKIHKAKTHVSKRSLGWPTNCVPKPVLKKECKYFDFDKEKVNWCVYYKVVECTSLDKKARLVLV